MAEPEPERQSVGRAEDIPSRIHVEVHHALDLPAMDIGGASDPYVELRVVAKEVGSSVKHGDKSEKAKTSVVKKTLNPVWNQGFDLIDNLHAVGTSNVVFKVWDEDLTSDDFIGQCEVDLLDVLAAENYTITRQLDLHDHSGKPLKSAKHDPRLNVTVHLTFGGPVVHEHKVVPHNFLTKWFYTNETVDKYYTIAEKLGSGSFAVVRKGISKADGTVYAVKYIDKRKLGQDDAAMLESECAVLKEVNHPNIVILHEIFDSPEELVLVMEFANGGEMLEKLKKMSQYSEGEASETVYRICDALVYLHKKGIAHRDLKPENLLLVEGDNSVVKVVDFGFAKIMSLDGSALKTACGTPEYVAPEVLALNGYDMECDIWSLGVVLYVMLCGRPPFWDSNQRRLFDKIAHEPLEFPSSYGFDDVSDIAKDLLTRMLTKDPKDRITAAAALEHPWLQNRHEFGDRMLPQSSVQNLNLYRDGGLV